MTKASGTYTSTLSTVPNYVNMMSTISTAVGSVLTKTADTGQVSWGSVTTLVAQGTVRDYEVFAFTDALQATKPIYVRLDYSGNATSTGINCRFGTTTDGAGTLGGFVLNLGAFLNMVSTGGGTRNVYTSSDGSYLALALNLTGASSSTFDGLGGVVVERTRDADGTANGLGYNVWYWSATVQTQTTQSSTFGNSYARIFDSSIVQPGGLGDPAMFIPSIGGMGTSALVSSVAYAFPAYTFGLAPGGASKALMFGMSSDFPRQSTVTISHYGTNMTFLPMAGSAMINVAYMSTATTAAMRSGLSPMFRWE